jgi:subtilisin family serine protease
VRITILDTGWAAAPHAPNGLPGISVAGVGDDLPDEDGDGFLDPAAGHGTFIAGIIEQLAPGAHLKVISVLSGYGDGDESLIADKLWDLSQLADENRPHLVNLSFGGYTLQGMAPLASAISQLHAKGTTIVASAGNDATCVPMYPSVLPEVVGVAALDGDQNPAPFTNYGAWVRACTAGVDVTSIFFRGFNGAEPSIGGYDPDDFEGWAVWSGTSFAAPRVVAALAQEVAAGASPHDAVEKLIDDPALPRKPMLGTVVDPT